jgi:hypothetical protein
MTEKVSSWFKNTLPYVSGRHNQVVLEGFLWFVSETDAFAGKNGNSTRRFDGLRVRAWPD